MPVVRFREHDDDAARIHGRFSGRHALHRLINVLIERIAAVRRKNDVGRLRRDAAALIQEPAARLMRGNEVARHRVDDLLFAVQHHVQDELEPRRLRRPDHVAVDRIVLQDPRPRMRVGNELRAMIRHHGFPRHDARQYRFPAACRSTT